VEANTVSDIPVTDRVVIPDSEVEVAFVRSSGPGGQNVNKVASKVQLRWRPATSAALGDADRDWVVSRLASKLTTDGELIVSSGLTRDQGRNRTDAAGKLADLVRAALVRPKKRRATRPSAAAKARRLDEKKARGEKKRRRRSAHDE
jgi:ribosome-associated protein